MSFIKDSANEYGAILIRTDSTTTGTELDDVKEIDARHKEWFIDEFEKFCRHKALEGAIPTSTDLIEKSNYGAVEKINRRRSTNRLAKHMGTDYFANPRERIEHVRNPWCNKYRLDRY